MRQGSRRSIAHAFTAAVLLVGVSRAHPAFSADAKPSAAAAGASPSVVSAPAYPQVVIPGGEIPKDWTPKPVPYTGIGPDGKPITVFIAPTYTFTYAVGPPVPVAAVAAPPPRAAGYRPVPPAPPPPRPSVPYGTPWVFQTQGLQPVDPGIVVAKPYELPKPSSPWVAAAFPPATPQALAAAPPPPVVPQQMAGPLQPPPTQWIPASETVAPQPMAPVAAPPAAVGTQGGEVLASIAPVAIAGGAAAMAPQPIPTSQAGSTASSFPSGLAPSAAPQSTPPAVADMSASAASAHFWRVVGVHDGDTVTCIDDTNTKQKVRLAEIDAPEIGQDFGKVSRDALAEMVFGKTVEVRDQGKDRYGRWIANLSVDGIDVNRKMVATGNAWHYAAYSKDATLAELQQQAQVRKLGLWSQPSPTPPWEFRKNGGRPTTTADVTPDRVPAEVLALLR